MNLPKSEAKVVSKVLVDKGLSLRDVAEILGLSPATIMRYANTDVPEALKQFETNIKEAFKTKESVIAAKALVRIDEKITTARISEALDVYKTMLGKDSQTLIQNNVIIDEGKQKYAL